MLSQPFSRLCFALCFDALRNSRAMSQHLFTSNLKHWLCETGPPHQELLWARAVFRAVPGGLLPVLQHGPQQCHPGDGFAGTYHGPKAPAIRLAKFLCQMINLQSL
jgi:hypothetical protein